MHKNKLILFGTTSFLLFSSIVISNDKSLKNLPFSDPHSVDVPEIMDVSNLKGHVDYSPQDENYSQQYIALDHVGDIKRVWDKTQGEGTTIAIVDTGIDYNHPDFYDENGNSKLLLDYARYYCHVKGSSSAWRYPTAGETVLTSDLKYFDPQHSYSLEGHTFSGNQVISHEDYASKDSHGTNTASTAAAFGHPNDKTGIIGVAPKAKILPIKIDMYSDSVGNALQYIYELNTNNIEDDDVDVVNISICCDATYSLITTYANYLAQDGVIIVASAGNKNNDYLYYPAANPNVIGVGALEIDSDDAKASFSNFNPSTSTSSSTNLIVNLTAPGHVYVSDYSDGVSTYKKTQGTSFSSPIVAGAACLWKSLNPNGSFNDFTSALYSSCDDIGTTGWDTTFGYGRLNIGRLCGTSDVIDVSGVDIIDSTYVGRNATYQLSANISPYNATNQEVIWSSADPTIATVDKNGLVTGVKVGSTTITCKSLADDTKDDSCTVTVGNTNYYGGITATDSAGLSAQLHNLMFSTHTTYKSYDDCRNENGEYYAMDPGTSSEYLTDFYTQHDISKSWSGNSSGTWNREHVWCQSKSAGLWDNTNGSTKGGGADYHHIRPIEHDLNSTRNNNTYGLVNNKNSTTAKYSKTTSSANAYLGGYLENGVWEPLDSIKGDIARILMYVWVHYSSAAGGTTPSNYSSYVGNLQLNEIICAGSSLSASKAMLLNWHNQDPVSNSERIRNEAAYGYQGNRNPFIDHPEYANIIFATDVVHVSSVSLNTNSLSLVHGENSTLSATVLPVDANNRNVTWTVENANPSGCVTVDQTGKVTGVAPGTATVKVSSVDGNKTDTCTVTVTPIAVTSVSLNKNTLSIPCGSSDSTLSVTVNPSNASNKNVTWTVENADPSGCVSVNSSGKVTANAIGTATVKVTSAADSTKYATCTVTVTPVLVTSITITCAKSSLKVGDNVQVNLSTISPSNASNQTVDWISSNTDVLTVDLNGLVTAVGPGTANITAKAKDGSNVVSNAKTFTVSDILTSIEFTNLPTNNKVSYMSGDGIFALSVTAHYQSGASLDVTNQLSPSAYVDTTRLGTQHVKATYKHDGVTKTCEADFRVTNTGSSSYTEEIEGSTTKTEINSKTFYGNGNVSINGEIFSLTADTSTFGSTYEGRGQAIGKSGDGPATMSLTKNNQMRVTRVAVTTSGATGFKGGKLKVRVGSTYFSYISNPSGAAVAEAGDVIDTATLTTTSTEYVFEGDATGNVTAEWAQTSDVAIYIRAFEVKTETSIVNSYSGQEQAEAWANYFIDVTRGSNGPCLSSNLTTKLNGLKALWSDVKTEYLAMESDGKNAFCSTTPSFLVSECMRHYRYIVDTYGEDAQLEDFVVDGSGNAPTNVSFTNRFMRNVLDNSTIVIVVVCIVGVAAIGVFAIYKKRKEN